MDCKIMRNSSSTIFEPHLQIDAQLPFICHLDVTCGRRVCNFHENLELLFFLQGTGQVIYDGKCYNVENGDLIVVNSYAVHQVFSEETMTYLCLIVDKAFCKYNNIDISKLHFTEQIRDARFDSLIGQVIDEHKTQRPFRHAALKSAIAQILLLLCRSYSTQKTEHLSAQESVQAYVCSAVLYIKSNIGRKLTVDEIADAVGVSKYHLMRQFKRFAGYTITNYTNFIRCEYAKELLQTGKYKTKEVAVLCGFENESYFYTVFKKHTGALPSEFVSMTIDAN